MVYFTYLFSQMPYVNHVENKGNTMSIKQHAETRFVELMTELFQLDEAESLDFGIYRVIKRHNKEVREFLSEIVTANEQKCLTHRN
jgi:hypothetical protein